VAVTAIAGETYRATAVLQVERAVDPRLPGVAQRPVEAQALAESYAELLTARGFLRQVRARLPGRPDELAEHVEAERPDGTSMIRLTAEASGRRAAERLADGVAGAFVSLVEQLERQRTARAEAALRRHVTETDESLRRLRAGGAGERDERVVRLREERSAFADRLADLVAAPASVAVAARSAGSAEPTRADLVENILGGLLLSAVIVVGLFVVPARPAPAAAVEPEPLAEPPVEPRPEPPPLPAPAPPVVAVVEPAAGAVVRGRVPLVAEASVGAAVRFLASDGGPDWHPIPDEEWDTTALVDGQHWLTAVATNGAGLSTASEPRAVWVANGAPAPQRRQRRTTTAPRARKPKAGPSG
jgi:hypothetical protein